MIRRKALKLVLAASLALPIAGLAELPAKAGDQPALDDGTIIAIYNQVNSFDIETALIGQVMGHSPDVRALGKMVSSDHTGVRSAAHELAEKIGAELTLPAVRMEAAKSHYAAVAGLRELSGADFDAAYLKHEIAFHAAAIEAVKTVLVPAASHGELKAHFEAVLPHFQRHLDETRRVAGELGVE